MAYDGALNLVNDEWSSMIRDCSLDHTIPLSYLSNMEGPPKLPALRITGSYVPCSYQPQIRSGNNGAFEWMIVVQDSLGDDSGALVSPWRTKLFQGVCQGHWDCRILSISGRLCGLVKFDMHDHQPSQIFCLIVGETTEAGNRTKKEPARFDAGGKSEAGNKQRLKGQGNRERKLYHMLVLEKMSEDPDEKIFRRVGIAQAIWIGGVGYPVHELAEKGDLMIM